MTQAQQIKLENLEHIAHILEECRMWEIYVLERELEIIKKKLRRKNGLD